MPRRAMRETAAGRSRGALHGVPIAVKDLCNTEGVPTAAGMMIHRTNVPTEDATVVARLKAQGAVILGKLQMTEGAFGAHHPSIPAPLNPWNEAYWTGSSSSGSGAATAAGLCFASLGSDTGGSIRFPSTMNGLSGLKPTWGRVSRAGVFPLADSLDHIGPMCRSALDCAIVLGVIAGADERDPTAVPLPVPDYAAAIGAGVAGKRIGRPVNLKDLDDDGRARSTARSRRSPRPARRSSMSRCRRASTRPRATGCRCAPSNARSPTRRPIRRAPPNTGRCWPA